MLAWLKRFGLHMAAAVGATGIFVAAAAVGANQTRQQVASVAPAEVVSVTATPRPRQPPTVVVVATPTNPPQPAPTQAAASEPTPGAPNPPATKPNPARRTPTPATASDPAPATEPVAPERSLAGTIKDVLPDGLDVVGVGGREWRVIPAPGALIRLNGKAARLDALHVGDTVVILGQAQAREGGLFRFLSHAITARRK